MENENPLEQEPDIVQEPEVVQESEVVQEPEAVQEEPVPAKKNNVLIIIAAAVLGVVLLLGLGLAVIIGTDGFEEVKTKISSLIGKEEETPTEPETTVPEATDPAATEPLNLKSYTVSAEEAASVVNDIAATIGDQKLTNGELQVFYQTSMINFYSQYGMYLMYMGVDFSQPLDQQVFDQNTNQTWQEFMDVAAVLQRNNMKVGLPYTAITATGAVEVGVGAKDLYPTLLMQGGGSFYNKDLTATALDNQQALEAFETWTGFYTDYGFDLSYDFATLFRSGEMPMCITAYPMYGTLSAVATEIRGCWEMTVLPGTVQEDGSINRTAGASGSAAVILRDAKDPDACWQFLEWFTRKDTQADYGNRLENQLGEAARYASANLSAVELLNWSSREKEVLRNQRQWVREIPEIPGSYYTSRCMDNAFRSVIYDGDNPRKVFEKQVEIIDSELKRKRLELE